MSTPSSEARRVSRQLQPLLNAVRTDVCWLMQPGSPPGHVKSPITTDRIHAHVLNGPYVGAAHILPGESTTKVGLLDLDSHKGEVPWDVMVQHVSVLVSILERRGAKPIVFRSTGGSGVHIYCLWLEPQDAYSVREFLRKVLETYHWRSGTKGVVEREAEVFPKQDFVPPGKVGNMAILPLAGQSAYLEPMADFSPMPRDTPVPWDYSADVPVLEKPPRELVSVEPSVELKTFRDALNAIPNSDDQALDYDAWRNIVFSIHHATLGSEEGRMLAHEFSARNSKYDPDFLDERVWPYIDSTREGAITDRHVLYKASEFGWSDVSVDDFDVLPPLEDFDSLDPEDPPKDKPRSRFPVLSTAEFLDAPPPRWHIKGVLPQAELVVLYGASTAGKSFMALDLAAAIDRGELWRGNRVRQGRVVYICAEGAGGFRQRVRAYNQQYGCQLGLGVIEVAPNFLLKDDVIDVVKAIKAWGGADLVIVDTWAQVLPGANENSGEDIGKALSHCSGMHRALKATVVLVHHSGKDESRGARGWSGLKAAADAELEVYRQGEDRVLSITKMKDGQDGAAFGFRLLPITVGLDEDGDDITSCIVAEHTVADRRAKTKRDHRGGGLPATVLKVLADNLIDVGGGLYVETLINEVVEVLPEPEPGARDARRANVKRALRALEDEGDVEVRGMFIHLPDQEGGGMA